jgi:hypothetical protein
MGGKMVKTHSKIPDKIIAQETLEYVKQENKTAQVMIAESKRMLKNRKKLIKPKEPCVFLLRPWRKIEIYSNIQGTTFIIPDPKTNKQKIVEVGESKHLIEGKKVAYLDPSSLCELEWGDDTLRGYFIDSRDAMPWGTNVKAWSETLEMTISAILVNYRNLMARQNQGQNKWLVDIIKYAIIGGIAYVVLMWLLGPEPAAEIVTTGQQFSEGGISGGN